eukprot:scaffold79066_cov21-Tisochrysis_lutea.AAC.1
MPRGHAGKTDTNKYQTLVHCFEYMKGTDTGRNMLVHCLESRRAKTVHNATWACDRRKRAQQAIRIFIRFHVRVSGYWLFTVSMATIHPSGLHTDLTTQPTCRPWATNLSDLLTISVGWRKQWFAAIVLCSNRLNGPLHKGR